MNEMTFWDLVDKATAVKAAKAKLDEAKATYKAAEEALEVARTQEEYARMNYRTAYRDFADMLGRITGSGTER